jgi:hypothetical protein
MQNVLLFKQVVHIGKIFGHVNGLKITDVSGTISLPIIRVSCDKDGPWNVGIL